MGAAPAVRRGTRIAPLRVMRVTSIATGEQWLLDAALKLSQPLDRRGVASAMLDVAERLFTARAAWLLLYDEGSDTLRTIEYRGAGAGAYADASVHPDTGIVGLAFRRGETVFVPDVAEEDRWFEPARVKASDLQSVFTVPITVDGHALGVVGIDSPLFSADRPPDAADIERIRALATLAGIGLCHAQAVAAIDADRQRLRQLLSERRQLRGHVDQLRHEVRQAYGATLPVGSSPRFARVLAQVALVAPADATVLLTGETGTGKELIARSLHEQSRRAGHPFVAVNCAALPESLVESELFGHEKGAFTGAVSRTIGKFELAHRGTLFLDEIGDLPAAAQAKLLRVLQDGEVLLVGGTRPVEVDVRLIAATNQDLEALIATGRFRQDLFYRLNVFPIVLPPLRERRDDIPALAEHFARVFGDRQHRHAIRLGDGVIEALQAYDWPGNIRELQNVFERAVILSRDGLITRESLLLARPAPVAAPSAAAPPSAVAAPAPGVTAVADDPVGCVIRFSEAERRVIVRALELAGWRISGAGGAADILGLKPTTLHAKMKKLGVQRPRPPAVLIGREDGARP